MTQSTEGLKGLETMVQYFGIWEIVIVTGVLAIILFLYMLFRKEENK